MSSEQRLSFGEFLQENSMHGVRYTSDGQITLKRRLVWCLMVVSGITYFGIASCLFIIELSNKPVSTKVTVETTKSIEYPTITICNRNSIKRSSLKNLGWSTENETLFGSVWYDVQFSVNVSKDRYDWEDPFLSSLLEEKFMESFLHHNSHSMEETMLFCRYQGVVLPCSEIFEVVGTDSGLCFRFNSKGEQMAYTTGSNKGLTLMLDTKVEEYFPNRLSSSEGFVIALHDSKDAPAVSEVSYGVSPGNMFNVMLRQKKINRVPPPADGGRSNCFDADTEPNPLQFFSDYSYTACVQECRTFYTIDQCGCRDYLHPPRSETRTCNPKEMMECSNNAMVNIHQDPTILEQCNCIPLCSEVRYSADMSISKFPSLIFERDLNYSAESADYLRHNAVTVNLFHPMLEYDLIEEKVAYTAIDIIANLGGTLGISLGASILTLAEFLEFLILKVTHSISYQWRKGSSLTPVVDLKDSQK